MNILQTQINRNFQFNDGAEENKLFTEKHMREMLVDEEECEKSQETFYRHYFGIIPWQSPFSRTKWLLNSTNRTNIQRYQPNELKVHNKISFVILLLRDLEIPAQIVTNDTAVHTVVIRNGLSLSADDAPNEWIYGDKCRNEQYEIWIIRMNSFYEWKYWFET